MWVSLVAAVALLFALCYPAGFLVLRGFGARRGKALACAPIVTIVGYSALAIAYAEAGVTCSWSVLAAPLCVVAVVIWAAARTVRRRRAMRAPMASAGGGDIDAGPEPGLRALPAYVASGLFAAVVMFAVPLGQADAFICGFDIAHHLSVARSFVESGNWSTLHVTSFPGEPGGFYPSVNSLLAALVLSCLNVPVTLSLNAVNAFVLALVFPFGMWALLSRLFGGDDARVALGAVAMLLFIACPWELLTRSAPVLYAFVVGICLVPAALAALVDFLDCLAMPQPRGAAGSAAAEAAGGSRSAVRAGLLAVLGLAAVALSHPSALFSALLFLIAYAARAILVRMGGKAPAFKAAAVVAWLALCAVAWVAVSRAPFMQSVVTYVYNPHTNPVGCVALVFTQWAPHVGSQYVLGFVIALGALSCLLDRSRRWMVALYLLVACVAYCALAIEPGPFRFLVTGFWYNHPTRVMATLALYSMPLVAQGLGVLLGVRSRASRAVGRHARPLHGRARLHAALAPSARVQASGLGAVLVAAVVAAIAFAPVPLPHATTLLEYERQMADFNDPEFDTSFLKPEERDFLARAALITGDSLVLNAPHDGSGYAYALCGMNTTARSFHVYADEDANLLARKAHLIAEDPQVAQAAKSLGVEYVIQLDAPDSPAPTVYKADYDPDDWRGIFAIAQDTAGYDLVLSEGDMRLYRIVAS